MEWNFIWLARLSYCFSGRLRYWEQLRRCAIPCQILSPIWETSARPMGDAIAASFDPLDVQGIAFDSANRLEKRTKAGARAEALTGTHANVGDELLPARLEYNRHSSVSAFLAIPKGVGRKELDAL